MMSQYQKRYEWTDKLSKTEKTFAFSNENGHFWTHENDSKTLRVNGSILKTAKKNRIFKRKWIRVEGADSMINLDANTR